MLTAAATGTLKSAADFFPVKVGDRIVRMQLAVRPGEMQRGLMERRDLGPDEGMLFVYERPQALSFWMRNTPTPLDIGFFDRAGVLQEVYPLHPFDETPVASRGRELQFALEMNQGWFRASGIKPGAKLDLPGSSPGGGRDGGPPPVHSLGISLSVRSMRTGVLDFTQTSASLKNLAGTASRASPTVFTGISWPFFVVL